MGQFIRKMSQYFSACMLLVGEGNGIALQYSCLENSVDRGAWWAAVHGVTKSRTQLKRLSMHTCVVFPGGSNGEASARNAGDLCSIPGLGRSPGEGKDYPLQYSGLENSMDCIVHRVAKMTE